MSESWFENYRRWLEANITVNREREKQVAVEDFRATIMNSIAYQCEAKVNGVLQPIVASRTETRKCNLAVVPETNIFIGDVVDVFNETWLCVEMHTDEYGLSYGELWLCNQKFKYLDFDGNVVEINAILDDGSYSKGTESAIKTIDADYQCYTSMTQDTNSIYVDKRLAIDKIYDNGGNQILEVGKVAWIDKKSKNFGEGSHLLSFALKIDVFNSEADSIDQMICDYSKENIPEPIAPVVGGIIIEGRASLMIGAGRTYKASYVTETGESTSIDFEVKWYCEGAGGKIKITPNNDACVVKVPLAEELVGENFKLYCEAVSGDRNIGVAEIEVIDIG